MPARSAPRTVKAKAKSKAKAKAAPLEPIKFDGRRTPLPRDISPALMTPEEAAAYLNIPLKRLKEHVLAGDIAFVQLGERVKRYERDGLDEFIAVRRMRRAGE